ncbi:hypothetical protein N802_04540 [Knoellia sinensis KCTC 19936]|uniref:Uncharacterized protein n=1 Tax=Knoellia sinensis KCTC 19936 TaxID=1385520 RepID=A0A0A0J3T4_9MICO|nr:hypothetical protein [Knoellia sinensis]KGN31364.1 hypothetical protein N802_04540 [Knoellia sinensis KCTC 19936]
MQLGTHHRYALAGAVVLSALALYDAATWGLTGHSSVFVDTGPRWAQILAGVVHVVAYTGALAVLHAERRRIHTNRAAAVFGWLLFVAFIPLAVGYLLIAIPAVTEVVQSRGEVVFGLAFGLQFLAAIGLGLSLVKHPETRIGSRILLGIVPTIGLTAALAAWTSNWAHPAYVEAVTLMGIALLATRTPTHRPDTDSARRALVETL